MTDSPTPKPRRRNRRSGVEDRWNTSQRVPRLDRDGNPKLDKRGHPLTDPVKSKSYGVGKRWRARYVDDQGREHAKGFDRKPDAEAWLEQITAAQVTGNYVDPQRGKITFASFYREWSSRQVWVPGTVQAMNLAANSVPFSHVAMADLRPSHLETWVKAMQDKPLAPGTIKTRFNNVRSVLRAAKRDKVLGEDPTLGVTLPRRRRAEAAMVIPTPEQVGALIRESSESFRAFTALCSFAGLRLGECAALQVGDIDFLRREIRVERQVQRANGHRVEIRAPKYGSERIIPVPSGLLELVAEHIRLHTPNGEPTRWLFPGDGDHPMHQNSVGHRWRVARKAAGADDLHLHSLRHFYASGLIASGCDVVTVQRALGHSSATVTLSTYSHLWPTAADRTRAAADALFNETKPTLADASRTEDAK
ncbi:tyrosine-type recombinase/integrase [Rhodococcus opacus]|uniref:tyrosine-type recombinase/integrase n=1 Tax=Rhodococcus opacus TaxID=37919 RepID=UPI000AD47C60|nr:site-specific integrase [Rhodococcus opacus]